MRNMPQKKKCFEWESNLQPNHYGVVSFRWGLTDRAMSDTSPSRISTNENYFYHWKSNQVQQTDQTIIYFWFQAVLPNYYFVKMKTWKTEKARLMRHGVEFPKPRAMSKHEKVEILVKNLIYSCIRHKSLWPVGMIICRKSKIIIKIVFIVLLNFTKNGDGPIVWASKLSRGQSFRLPKVFNTEILKRPICFLSLEWRKYFLIF